MKYDHDIKWVRKVLQSADIMNTFNGGTASPQTHVKKLKDSKIIYARVPGVSPEELRVEVINGNLIVYHNVNFDTLNSDVEVPHVVTTTTLDANIDRMGIQADYQNGILKITLPYNNMEGDFHKDIKIDIDR
ncbi:Hsp20/alpha crystallin family protein [Fulvivirga ligni]|uniref:Hsp20/alpha crystallin family protein n=1 Tax=Fulvivirga ligni TaxID=2904246 RepID=UPI001F2FF1A3|nr:Hsp20/alpha crystallin family protein [Fulvivirga ligni]UII19295.1 Hsp20/alpha crystallin family protein [Fulvivirga ligni]